MDLVFIYIIITIVVSIAAPIATVKLSGIRTKVDVLTTKFDILSECLKNHIEKSELNDAKLENLDKDLAIQKYRIDKLEGK